MLRTDWAVLLFNSTFIEFVTPQRWKSSTFITTEPFCRIQHLKVVFSIILQIKEIAQINEIYTSALSTAFLKIFLAISDAVLSERKAFCRVHIQIQAVMITLYRVAVAQVRKSYRIGLLFTRKNGDFGAISVTERSCSVPISKWSVTHRIGSAQGRGRGPYKRLLAMCRWMGSHFHDWIDYNGVGFSMELPEWGLTFSDFWSEKVLHIYG